MGGVTTTSDTATRLAVANAAADDAMRAYDQRKAWLLKELTRTGRARGYEIFKRDDRVLAELAGAAAFHIANATRLAAVLQTEQLAELLARTPRRTPVGAR
jgi:molybdopterin-biosynthesis enzyme MoeA-like protein